ncbi:MAG: DUF4139 domain-containing protein [Kofleriaceae bacterium]
MDVASRPLSVVVFARGALVRRVAQVPVPESRLRLTGLPLAVIDDTVRVELTGSATATAIRVAEDVVAVTETEESDALRAARRRVTLAESEAARIGLAIDRIATAPLVGDDPSEEPPAPWANVVAARRELITLRSQRETQLREQLSAARREVDEAQRLYNAAVEADARAGTARIAKLHEPRKYVELELAIAAPGAITIHLEYQVRAARWAPSYVARLDGDKVGFELRAVVAQASGEDWTNVAMKLSTAEPTQFSELPELQPQKIGRRQIEPAKKGFRAPPTGAGELYRDFDQSFPRRSTSFKDDDATPAPDLAAPPMDQVWDDESSAAGAGGKPLPKPAAPPFLQPSSAFMPQTAPMAKKSASIIGGIVDGIASFAKSEPMPSRSSMPAPGAPAMFAGGGGAARGMMQEQRKQAPAAPGEPVPRLDYAQLMMAPAGSPHRGQLIAVPRTRSSFGAAPTVDSLAFPPGHHADWQHVYDYAFVTDGAVDVRSDGAWHSIAVTTKQGTAKLSHVAVPREQADVFRVAALANPLDGPLLPGPIDVYDRGQFLVTSDVDYTPPGGSVEVGLGVDAQVKIARNVEFHEEASGMLRGKLELIHAIAIDVENLGARAVDLEVRERIPVVRDGDDDVEVSLTKIDPQWERWTPDPNAPSSERLRGAYRWRVAVPPAQKKTLRATYEIKIAGKHELVGGNRREP